MKLIEAVKQAMRQDGLDDAAIEEVLKKTGEKVGTEILSKLEIPPGEEDVFIQLMILGKDIYAEHKNEGRAISMMLHQRLAAHAREKARSN